jgi:formyl-CoA transferase
MVTQKAKSKAKVGAKKPLRATPKLPPRPKPKKGALKKAATAASTVRGIGKAVKSAKSGNGTNSANGTKGGKGVPAPSKKPWGQAGKALEGVRVLDFTHVQSGPTCTQLLAFMGADVIKVERPGAGDITRGQLRDIPKVDSLYFTMLNGNKRSITIDSKHSTGKEVLDRLIKQCDVLVENFAPGALDRMGLTWEHINKLNPRMVVASVKGFGPGPY